MQIFNLDSMIKGWFVGDFEPCAWKSKDFEVAVKYYKKGECEVVHYHKIAHEITLIVQGRVKMGGVEFSQGQIVLLEPRTSADFIALTDAITAVVKVPSAKNDKFLGECKGESGGEFKAESKAKSKDSPKIAQNPNKKVQK